VEKLHLAIVDSAAGSALTAILLLGGGLAWLTAMVTRIAGTGYLGGLVLAGVTLLLFGAVSLPFAFWRTFRIEQKYGFNRTTLGLFLLDLIKGAVVAVVLGAPFILLIDFIMRNSGALWWLLAWGVYVAFNLVMLLIVPTAGAEARRADGGIHHCDRGVGAHDVRRLFLGGDHRGEGHILR